MCKVLIEDIEHDGVVKFTFDGDIKELEECHLSAEIDFCTVDNFIQAKGHSKGSIILECDRCLNKFVYNLDFDINETFAKNTLLEKYGQELELSESQFVTDLDGADEIDVYDLLYQSVILALPNKKVCGINCNEGTFVSDEGIKVHDERMDVFKNIRIEK